MVPLLVVKARTSAFPGHLGAHMLSCFHRTGRGGRGGGFTRKTVMARSVMVRMDTYFIPVMPGNIRTSPNMMLTA